MVLDIADVSRETSAGELIIGCMATPIKTFSIEQLEEHVLAARLPKFRVQQILSWLYVKGVSSYDQMTNLPKAAREQFAIEYPLHTFNVKDVQVSTDGSRKYLLESHDGALVETVGLPSADGRLTVCASSQSGCAMGCVFCATGRAGLTRSLVPGEIVDQVLLVQREFDQRVTNVVVMGQGEPFSNYNDTLAALRILNHPKLLNIAARHMTVSTCGVIRGISRFAAEPEQFGLAVSLHAARQEVRDRIMPGVKNYNLDTLRRTLQDYASNSGRRFSFEYALMKGVNDSNEDLQALIDYCKGLLCHVNLIPLNKVEGSGYKPAPRATLAYWKTQLEKANIPVSIRASRGSDIAAACGQLAARAE